MFVYNELFSLLKTKQKAKAVFCSLHINLLKNVQNKTLDHRCVCAI